MSGCKGNVKMLTIKKLGEKEAMTESRGNEENNKGLVLWKPSSRVSRRRKC